MAVKGTCCSMQAWTEEIRPGSLMQGVPASEIRAIFAPSLQIAQNQIPWPGFFFELIVRNEGFSDLVAIQQDRRSARIFAQNGIAYSARVLRALCEMSSRFPIGVEIINNILEKVALRFELRNGGFAGLCLTTWLCHRQIS